MLQIIKKILATYVELSVLASYLEAQSYYLATRQPQGRK